MLLWSLTAILIATMLEGNPIVSLPLNGTGQNRPAVETSNPDRDSDGLNDSYEQTVAERFAPIVFHDPKEPNLPTNVGVFLPDTDLWFYDSRCKQRSIKIAAPLVNSIPRKVQPACDPGEAPVDSYGTRSQNKKPVLFFENGA